MSGSTVVLGDEARTRAARAAARQRHPSARGRPRARRPPPPARYYGLLAVVTVLTLLGLVMVLSASSVTALHADGSGWVYFRKQLLWAGLGVVALVVAAQVPLAVWRRLTPALLVGAYGLMVLVLVPGIGREVNGARAWLELGPLRLQPVEVLKLALLLHVADLLTRRADQLHDRRRVVHPPLVLLGLAGILVMLQPDLGSGIVLVAIVLGVLFVGGVPLLPLAGVTAAFTGLATLFMLSTPYRRDRWLAFLDLANHRQGAGFQLWQSLIGIASGGVTGVGLGAGKAKWGYLPEAHTDFIFAIVAEELGLIGATVVCGLFLALGALGVHTALRAGDRFGQLVAGGITAWLLVQALINIGGVVGLIPLTGLTLPFVSFGGSSLVVTLAAAGLLLNVARR